MNERKVLGRGLSSLIRPIAPDTKPASEGPALQTGGTAGEMLSRPHEVPVNDINVNPRQPRRRFSEKALEELAQSVKEFGVLQPITVRKTDHGYELIAGERRLRAAKAAGLARIPVLIRASSDVDQLEVALIENLQREDLNPIEEARGYQQLSKEFDLTQEEIAKKVGKDRSTVANLLRLLALSTPIQEMIEGGAISMGHARALLPLEDGRRQETLAQRIEKEGLSVRQVEGLVRSMLKPTAAKGRRASDLAGKDPNVRHFMDELQRSLGTRVEVLPKGKGGEIRIHYYTHEDLKRLTDRFLK